MWNAATSVLAHFDSLSYIICLIPCCHFSVRMQVLTRSHMDATILETRNHISTCFFWNAGRWDTEMLKWYLTK